MLHGTPGQVQARMADSVIKAANNAVIHVRLTGAVHSTATLSGPSTSCELVFFPATKGAYATPASTALTIAANAPGVIAKPPAKDAFALEMMNYKPGTRTYSSSSSSVLLSVVLNKHSYFVTYGNKSIVVHTANGGKSGTFSAMGLKPNNGTTGGTVNASGSWSCEGFLKTTF
jgi:hypothetical protein